MHLGVSWLINRFASMTCMGCIIKSMNKSMTIVRQEVCRLLGGDTSGHSDEHVERVARLAERFANEYKKEAASMDEVLLTAKSRRTNSIMPRQL